MIQDHMPDKVLDALNKVCRDSILISKGHPPHVSGVGQHPPSQISSMDNIKFVNGGMDNPALIIDNSISITPLTPPHNSHTSTNRY